MPRLWVRPLAHSDAYAVTSQALQKAQAHIPHMSNSHISEFFEEFRRETKSGGKWGFVREERGALRVCKYGHTRTYRRVVTMLQLRAVDKYRDSRILHGGNSLIGDERKIQALLEYNQRCATPHDLSPTTTHCPSPPRAGATIPSTTTGISTTRPRTS